MFFWLRSAAIAATVTLSSPAFAEYPSEPVRLVLGFAQGDGGDALGRAVASRLEKALGTNVVVENLAGGGGAVAMTELASREADGHSIAMTLSLASAFVPLTGRVDYTAEDFDYLGSVSLAGTAFLGRADSGYSDFAGLMAKAVTDGYLTYGSLVPVDRLIMQAIAASEGFELDIIGARGGGPLRAALLAGDTEAVLGGASGLLFAQENAEIAALATFNSERLEAAPDVPTLRELGYDFDVDTYYLIAAPTGLPEDVSLKLQDAISQVVQDPELSELIRRLGSVPVSMTADEARALVDAKIQSNTALLNKLK